MMPSKTYITMTLAASMFAGVHAQSLSQKFTVDCNSGAIMARCMLGTDHVSCASIFGLPLYDRFLGYDTGGHLGFKPDGGPMCAAFKKKLEVPTCSQSGPDPEPTFTVDCNSGFIMTHCTYSCTSTLDRSLVYDNGGHLGFLPDSHWSRMGNGAKWSMCAAFKKQLEAPCLSAAPITVAPTPPPITVAPTAAPTPPPITVAPTAAPTPPPITVAPTAAPTAAPTPPPPAKACTVEGASDRDKYYDNQWKVNYYDMAKKSPCEACHDKCDVDYGGEAEKCHKGCAKKVKNCKSSEDQCTDMTGPDGLHCAYDKETDHCYTKELSGSHGGSGDGSGDACTSAHGDSSQSNAGATKRLSAGSSPSNADDTASSSAPSATTECNHEDKRDPTLIAVLVLTVISLISNIVLVFRAQTTATNAGADVGAAGEQRVAGSFDGGELRKLSQVSNEGRFSISNI